MDAGTTFDPQAGYVVTASNSWVTFNDQTLATFYQPILGPIAFSLFYALKARLKSQPTIADRLLQSDLLTQLNAGSQQIETALHRLEGLGLVQTYFQHDQLGDVYVYELHPTLTPTEFLADNLLSVLLLEEVGEQHFEQLVQQSRRFRLASANTKLSNISHHFLDEFSLNSRLINNPPTTIKQARASEPVETRLALTANLGRDFDWTTLLKLLAQQPLIKEDLAANQDLILVEHQLYGIDEPTMKQLILRSINLNNNHFDPQKFKQIVAASYNVVYASPTKIAEKSAEKTVEQDQLTQQDQQLLKTAEDYAPVEFLQVLKAQIGGYVTSNERHLLTRLVEEGKFTAAAINILSWYVISDRGNATLSTNFVDTIANNWLRNGITTGQQALVQLKNFNQQGSTPKKQSGKKYQRSWRKPVEEQMPAWSKKKQEEVMKKASPQEIAKIRERIANRKKK